MLLCFCITSRSWLTQGWISVKEDWLELHSRQLSNACYFLLCRAPSLIPTGTGCGYRQPKARLGRKHVRPWKWMLFTNPARQVSSSSSTLVSLLTAWLSLLSPYDLGQSRAVPLAPHSRWRQGVSLRSIQQETRHTFIHWRRVSGKRLTILSIENLKVVQKNLLGLSCWI